MNTLDYGHKYLRYSPNCKLWVFNESFRSDELAYSGLGAQLAQLLNLPSQTHMRNSGDRSATTSFTSADPLCQIRCLSERVQSTNASVNNAGASSNISATNCLAAYSDNFTKDAIEDEDESVYFTPGHKDSIPMNKHLTLKPVIRELVRTKVCFQDIKLLVDKISIVKLSTKENSTANEAYRLFLTDRESTIQGLFCIIVART